MFALFRVDLWCEESVCVAEGEEFCMATTSPKPPGYAALRSAMLTRLEQASDLAVRPLPAKPAEAAAHSARLRQLIDDAATLAGAMTTLLAMEPQKRR